MTDRGDQPPARPGRRLPPPGTGKAGRGPFTALRPEIERELMSGVAIATVYERFKDRLGFSYSNFTKYVRRYLPNAVLKPGGEEVPPGPPPPPIEAAPPPPAMIGEQPRDRTASKTQEPLQAPPSDRPRRFKSEPKSESELF